MKNGTIYGPKTRFGTVYEPKNAKFGTVCGRSQIAQERALGPQTVPYFFEGLQTPSLGPRYAARAQNKFSQPMQVDS